ncbi:hypothetical protein RB195_005649 [Necator americanus]|uniref:Uncharacterized protein n=1 Tax=Necator americanus TaxID=51031 RepID=A0ABR1BQF9_NECAM
MCHLDDELKVIAKKEPVTEELTCEQKHIDKQQAKKEGPNCELQAEDDKKVELTSKTVQGLLAYNGSPTQLSGELEDFAGRELASEELDCGLEPTDRKEAKSGKVPCEQETFKEELKSEDDKMAQSVPYSLDELKKDLSRIVYLKRVIGQLKACIEMADYLCQNLEQTNVERLAQLEESVTEKEHKF